MSNIEDVTDLVDELKESAALIVGNDYESLAVVWRENNQVEIDCWLDDGESGCHGVLLTSEQVDKLINNLTQWRDENWKEALK